MAESLKERKEIPETLPLAGQCSPGSMVKTMVIVTEYELEYNREKGVFC